MHNDDADDVDDDASHFHEWLHHYDGEIAASVTPGANPWFAANGAFRPDLLANLARNIRGTFARAARAFMSKAVKRVLTRDVCRLLARTIVRQGVALLWRPPRVKHIIDDGIEGIAKRHCQKCPYPCVIVLYTPGPHIMHNPFYRVKPPEVSVVSSGNNTQDMAPGVQLTMLIIVDPPAHNAADIAHWMRRLSPAGRLLYAIPESHNK